MILHNFIPLLIFAVIFLNSYGQGKQDKNVTLSHIKKVFQKINDYKNYKIVTIYDAEKFLGHGTDNGGDLKGFYKGDSLKKIIEWVGLSNRVLQHEYYFDNGKLVFVYSTDSRCKFNDNTQEFDCLKFDKVLKARYYFKNEELIDAILTEKEQEKTKLEDSKDFLASSKDYMKQLDAKRK